MEVHIGKVIHDLVKESGLKVKFVADFVNVGESTLFDIYKRASIDVDKLIKFSELLNKNLFIYYLDVEPIKSLFGQQVHILQATIEDQRAEIEKKDERIADLLELTKAQKKIIALQEDKEDSGKKRN